MMKTYPNLTPDYILNQMSYKNLIMYSRIIPSYNPTKEDDSKSIKVSNKDFFSTLKQISNG